MEKEEPKPRTRKKRTVSEVSGYKVLVDLAYKGNRVKAGEIVEDIPEESLGWLLDGNYIRKVK